MARSRRLYRTKVIVEGIVVDTYDSGKAIFLNFAENYSETFTAVIFSSNEYKFNFEPEDYYIGKKVKIRDNVKEYKGVFEIVVEG